MPNTHIQTRKLTFMAVMLSMIFVLSVLEHMLPTLPFLPPNVRLGLSNVITMYALFFLGKRSAFLLAFLKSGFVLITRGAMAGALSLSGGIFSLLWILVFAALFKRKITYLILSIIGAIMHNIGQLGVVSFIMNTSLLVFYMPVILVSGIIMGTVTGILLRIVMPLFQGLTSPYNKE